MAFWITTRQSARMEEGSAEEDDDDDAMTISFTKTAEEQRRATTNLCCNYGGGREGGEEGGVGMVPLQDEWTLGKTTAKKEGGRAKTLMHKKCILGRTLEAFLVAELCTPLMLLVPQDPSLRVVLWQTLRSPISSPYCRQIVFLLSHFSLFLPGNVFSFFSL